MSSTNLEVVFEGQAVKAGTIDARLLAESLLGYNEVFVRANSLINGQESTAAVMVQSEFKSGSFIAGLELVQNVTEQGKHLITAHQFLSAEALTGMIGFLTPELAKEFLKEFAKETVISIFRWLKGKKPDEVKRTGNGQVELKASGETKIVNINVFNLYGDSVIRDGLDKVTKPLREAAIERIKVKKDSTEQTVFYKEEADIFKAEPLALQTQSAEPLEGERDAVLVVSKLSFKEGVSWTFFERGAIVVAKIEDEQFWERVHSHEVTFGEGDLLKVRLFWEIQRRHHEIKQKNTILKVLDKLERPEQLQFDVESEKPKRRTHKRKVN